jgi:hypothetical protein
VLAQYNPLVNCAYRVFPRYSKSKLSPRTLRFCVYERRRERERIYMIEDDGNERGNKGYFYKPHKGNVGCKGRQHYKKLVFLVTCS